MRGTAAVHLPTAPGGVREDINPVEMPEGWLMSSSNWMVQEGVGVPRPGYVQMDSQVAAADRIIGIGFRGSDQDTDNIVLHTLTAAYHWSGSSQTDITGTWSASTADQLVRYQTYRSGGTIWLARVNQANAIDKWDGTASAFQDVSAAPAGIDITATQEHLIVARHAQFGVQWSDENDIDTWPAGNAAFLDQTPGDVMAVKKIGPLSFAVYKEDAVYLATRQAAATAYRFTFVASVPGPISPAVVVDFPWGHIWLGTDNTLYKFDGGTVTTLSRALATTLGSTLHISNRGRSHAMRRRRQSDEAWFFYPDESTGNLTRGVSVIIVDPTSVTKDTILLHAHTFGHQITASASWRDRSDLTIDGLDAFSTTNDGLDAVWDTIDAMTSLGGSVALLGDVNGNFYEYGRATTDDGTAIAWDFEYPHKTPAGIAQRFFADGIASYWVQTASSVLVTVTATFTDSLSDAESTQTGTFNTNVDGNHFTTFVNQRAKWAKIQHGATSSTSDLAYRGATFYAFPRNMV